MKTEGQRRGLSVVLTICVVVFVAVFVIVNATSVIGVVSSVLKVFSPVIVGFAIAYMLNPILRLFEFKVYKKMKKKSALRALSILSTYVIAVLIIVAFLWLLIPSIITSIVDLVSKYDQYIAGATSFINDFLNKFLSNDTFSEYVNVEAVNRAITNFFSTSGDILGTVLKYVVEYGDGLFEGFKNVVLGIFISIYVLISKERLQAQFKKICAAILPEKKNSRFQKYLRITHRTFSSFFVGKIIDSVIILLIMLALMLIFRLEYALLISVIVGVTNIIPVFGPILGAIPSFFILFIVEPKQALIFLVLVILVQQLDGNVIGPKILGESTGISSLGVIVAIIVMGAYWGVFGMLVGVPIFAIGTTILKEFFETRLKKRGKPTDTAEYYLKDSIVDPHEQHEHISKKLFDNITQTVQKLWRKIFKKKGEKSEAQENTDSEEQKTDGENTEENTEEKKEEVKEESGDQS